MLLEVKQWAESQDVMDKPDWFFIQTVIDNSNDILGSSAYARKIEFAEAELYKLVRETLKLKDINSVAQGGSDIIVNSASGEQVIISFEKQPFIR